MIFPRITPKSTSFYTSAVLSIPTLFTLYTDIPSLLSTNSRCASISVFTYACSSATALLNAKDSKKPLSLTPRTHPYFPYLFFRCTCDPKHCKPSLVKMEMREHSTSASSIECVVNRIVMLCCMRLIVSQISRRLSGSRPVYASPRSFSTTLGSSRNTIWGSPAIAIASDRRRFCPPLSSVAHMLKASRSSPTICAA